MGNFKLSNTCKRTRIRILSGGGAPARVEDVPVFLTSIHLAYRDTRNSPFVNHHRSRGSCWIPVRHCLPAFPTVYEPDVRCLRLQSSRMFNEIHSQEASWISRTNVMIRIPRSSIAVMIVASNIDEFKNYDGTRGTSTSSNANVPSAISRGVAR